MELTNLADSRYELIAEWIIRDQKLPNRPKLLVYAAKRLVEHLDFRSDNYRLSRMVPPEHTAQVLPMIACANDQTLQHVVDRHAVGFSFGLFGYYCWYVVPQAGTGHAAQGQLVTLKDPTISDPRAHPLNNLDNAKRFEQRLDCYYQAYLRNN